MIGLVCYNTVSTWSHEYRSNSNRKYFLILMIGLTLKLFSVSVLVPGMTNDASNELFLIVCAGNRLREVKN